MRFVSRLRNALLVLSLLALSAPQAKAAAISIIPAGTSADVGDIVTIDIVASGLGAPASAPSLGTYDLTLGFDPLVVSFVDVEWGSGLDVLGLGEHPETCYPAWMSWTSSNCRWTARRDLDLLQPSSFLLARLRFLAIGEGSSPLLLSANALSDAGGGDIPADTQDGRIRVPEPLSGVLLLLGVASARVRAVRRRKGLTTTTGRT